MTKLGVTIFFALFLAFWAVLDTINYVMLKLLLIKIIKNFNTYKY